METKAELRGALEIGPIPTDDGLGKEVITRMTANMQTNKVFYTDSNGTDFIERVRDYRADWNLSVNQPVAGNYYPLNLGIFTSDNKSEFSVLVDRTTGGSSIQDGQVEMMLHRRLLVDDGRGVGEALDETVCISNNTCQGITADEAPQYSTLAKVELKKMLTGKKIKELKEMSLSANQEKSGMKKMKWKVEGSTGEEPTPVRGGPVDSSTLVVELGPMEIRTFLLKF
ncbi:hypothetical protein ACLB2K_008463 [Fragaria x ananassa]